MSKYRLINYSVVLCVGNMQICRQITQMSIDY